VNELNPIEELQWRLREQEKTIKEIEQKLRDTDYQSRLKNTKIRDLTARVEELENGFVKGDATQTHLNFWTLMHQG